MGAPTKSNVKKSTSVSKKATTAVKVTKNSEKTEKNFTYDNKNGKTIVIVESPSKIKTVAKYLDNSYVVVSTVGHLRQIPSKKDSVLWNGHEFLFQWQLDKKKYSGIEKVLGNVKEILIATDPDREGEAIAWHVHTLLRNHKIIQPISRITFNEITKNAIKSAINSPRDINDNLVNAYFTRVGLDYIIGFTLSPLLWLKMPLNNVSTGRVQTPTLGFIVERELERINFKSTNYYHIMVNLKHDSEILETTVCEYKNQAIGSKLEDEKLAQEINSNIPENFILTEVESKIINISPPVPFITSSLQQEGHRILGIKIAQVMQIAQQLYEGVDIDGSPTALITYMRTDSMTMSDDIIKDIRNFLSKDHSEHIPATPNIFKNTAKNIQEAHECIRPVNINIIPSSLKGKINDLQYKLYDMIWSRSIACQMNSAKREQGKFIFSSGDYKLKYNHSVIKYKGYLLFYNNCTQNDSIILNKGDKFAKKDNYVHTQETKPPARYNEASLIQKMEQEGIGRPSTYAFIVSTLLKREFVYEQGKQLVPTTKGSLVYFFMDKFFCKFIKTEFTSYVETLLDEITNGNKDYVAVVDNLLKEINEGANGIKEYVFNIVGEILIEKFHKICEICKNPYQLRYKNDCFLHCLTCKKNVPFNPPLESKINDNVKLLSFKDSGMQYLLGDDGKKSYLPKGFLVDENVDVNFIMTLPKIMFKYEGDDVTGGVTQYGFFLKYQNKYKSIDLDFMRKITVDDFWEFWNSKEKKIEN